MLAKLTVVVILYTIKSLFWTVSTYTMLQQKKKKIFFLIFCFWFLHKSIFIYMWIYFESLSSALLVHLFLLVFFLISFFNFVGLYFILRRLHPPTFVFHQNYLKFSWSSEFSHTFWSQLIRAIELKCIKSIGQYEENCLCYST